MHLCALIHLSIFDDEPSVGVNSAYIYGLSVIIC